MAVAMIETWIRHYGAPGGKAGSKWYSREGVGTEVSGPWFEYQLCSCLTRGLTSFPFYKMKVKIPILGLIRLLEVCLMCLN